MLVRISHYSHNLSSDNNIQTTIIVPSKTTDSGVNVVSNGNKLPEPTGERQLSKPHSKVSVLLKKLKYNVFIIYFMYYKKYYIPYNILLYITKL